MESGNKLAVGIFGTESGFYFSEDSNMKKKIMWMELKIVGRIFKSKQRGGKKNPTVE